MQFYNKYINTRLIALLILPLLLGGCLKKIDEANKLDTNIFDRGYTGEQWYIITKAEQVSNDLGQIKTRFSITIPEENVPELKPSNIQVHASGDGLEVTVYDFPANIDGGYKNHVDLPYTGVHAYCIELGIYVEKENSAINLFEECVSL